MEFISAEEFLKEDKDVQEVIDNSIKLCIGDRIYHKLSEKYYIYLGEYYEGFWNVFDLDNKCTGVFCKDYFCRCLHEGQLRKFIEDKTGKLLLTDVYNEKQLYAILLFDKKSEYGSLPKRYRTEETDLLQAYWQVVCEIAKESIKH